ncbi:TPA: KilA-N domain-containing protein [Morganella morganii]|nr:KilA-N domain-containing protein [Morganella morganii]
MNTKLPIVVGVEIPLDEHGRYNLNALHKASGLGDEKAPTKFMRNKTTKTLLSELEKQTGQICLVSAEGKNGGTFAHEIIAVEYAGWIRPDFRIQVNQAFIDFKSGNAELKLPSLSHMAGDFEALRNLLTLDEKEESALLTQCSLIMNARKKTKPKRQKLIDALKEAGQESLDFEGEA